MEPRSNLRIQPKGSRMDKLLAVLKSRKFWAALAGLAYLVIGARAGVSQDQLIAGVTVVVSYILGTALEDGLRGSQA
jgi:hypothetical protein